MVSPQSTISPSAAHELAHLKKEWWCFLLLGLFTIALGIAAVSYAPFVVGFVLVFGVLLAAAGVAQIISSFWSGQWSGFFLHLLVGIFYIVVGLIIIECPVSATASLTLLLAGFLMVLGIFRVVAALTIRFTDWGWALLSGFVALLLGLLIFKSWPASGIMAIGLFVGIEMIFNGWTWVMLSLTLRASPPVEE